MAGEWEEVFLEDVAEEITVGYVGSMASEYVSSGIPFLRSQNVESLRINDKDLKFISPSFHQKISKSRLTPGDVVIVRTGKPGACSVVPGWLKDANCSDLVIVRPNARIDNRFLAYYINSAATHHVAAHLVGAVQQHFNVGSARKMRINLPPLPQQKSIVSILGALDEKIELNRQMNATLEAMARALFQSWFVDFDPVRAKQEGRPPSGLDAPTAALFPDQFQDSELGPIPKGWRVGTVSDLCQFGRDSLNPLRFPDEAFDHYSLPAFDEGRLPKTEAGSEIKSNKLVVQSNAVLLSKLNPHIPRIWAPSPSMRRRGICSTEFLVVVPTSGTTREYLYSLLTSETFSRVYGTLVSGTTGSHQRIKADSVSTIKAVLPPRSLIDAFTNKTKPMLAGINQNIEQSRTLANLRDTLLPKLLSGELSMVHS